MAHRRGEEGSLPYHSPCPVSQRCLSPRNSGFFADSTNRKAFRDGIKPGWHYFGRKMVSGGRTRSFLAAGATAGADRWRSRAGVSAADTLWQSPRDSRFFLPEELVRRTPALPRRGCSAVGAPRPRTALLGFHGQAESAREPLGGKWEEKALNAAVVSPPDGCWGRGSRAAGSKAPGAAPAGRGRFRVGDVVHLVQERHPLRPLGTRPLRQDLLHDGAAGEPGVRWDGFESARGLRRGVLGWRGQGWGFHRGDRGSGPLSPRSTGLWCTCCTGSQPCWPAWGSST